VEKHFGCTLELAAEWLRQGRSLILVVDGGELVGDTRAERLEDLYIGGIPDHAVVLRAVDFEAGRWTSSTRRASPRATHGPSPSSTTHGPTPAATPSS
jgi:hypothetical protein